MDDVKEPPYRADPVSRGGYYGVEGPEGRLPNDFSSMDMAIDAAYDCNQAHAAGSASKDAQIAALVEAGREIIKPMSDDGGAHRRKSWPIFVERVEHLEPAARAHDHRVRVEAKRETVDWMRSEAEKLELMAQHLEQRLAHPPSPPYPPHLTPRPEAPAETRECARMYTLIAGRIEGQAAEERAAKEGR